MNRRQYIGRSNDHRIQWPHLSTLYAGSSVSDRDDEETRYVDPMTMFDNVYENPTEPYGAYKFYMAPREEFIVQSEPHLYTSSRSVFKDEDDRTSGYTGSGRSSSFRDGSTGRILLCVFLIFLLIGVVIAAVTMAVLLSQHRRTTSLKKEGPTASDGLESTIKITNRTFIPQYNDSSSPEYLLLEKELTTSLDAMFTRDDSPIKDKYIESIVLDFRPGSVLARYIIKLNMEDLKSMEEIVPEVIIFLHITIPKRGIWNPLMLERESVESFHPVDIYGGYTGTEKPALETTSLIKSESSLSGISTTRPDSVTAFATNDVQTSSAFRSEKFPHVSVSESDKTVIFTVGKPVQKITISADPKPSSITQGSEIFADSIKPTRTFENLFTDFPVLTEISLDSERQPFGFLFGHLFPTKHDILQSTDRVLSSFVDVTEKDSSKFTKQEDIESTNTHTFAFMSSDVLVDKSSAFTYEKSPIGESFFDKSVNIMPDSPLIETSSRGQISPSKYFDRSTKDMKVEITPLSTDQASTDKYIKMTSTTEEPKVLTASTESGKSSDLQSTYVLPSETYTDKPFKSASMVSILPLSTRAQSPDIKTVTVSSGVNSQLEIETQKEISTSLVNEFVSEFDSDIQDYISSVGIQPTAVLSDSNLLIPHSQLPVSVDSQDYTAPSDYHLVDEILRTDVLAHTPHLSFAVSESSAETDESHLSILSTVHTMTEKQRQTQYLQPEEKTTSVFEELLQSIDIPETFRSESLFPGITETHLRDSSGKDKQTPHLQLDASTTHGFLQSDDIPETFVSDNDISRITRSQSAESTVKEKQMTTTYLQSDVTPTSSKIVHSDDRIETLISATKSANYSPGVTQSQLEYTSLKDKQITTTYIQPDVTPTSIKGKLLQSDGIPETFISDHYTPGISQISQTHVEHSAVRIQSIHEQNEISSEGLSTSVIPSDHIKYAATGSDYVKTAIDPSFLIMPSEIHSQIDIGVPDSEIEITAQTQVTDLTMKTDSIKQEPDQLDSAEASVLVTRQVQSDTTKHISTEFPFDSQAKEELKSSVPQEISTVARSKTISEKEIQSLTDSFFISYFEALSGSESMQSSVTDLTMKTDSIKQEPDQLDSVEASVLVTRQVQPDTTKHISTEFPFDSQAKEELKSSVPQEISTVARSKTISEKEIQSLTDSFFISDFEALSGSESMQSSVTDLTMKTDSIKQEPDQLDSVEASVLVTRQVQPDTTKHISTEFPFDSQAKEELKSSVPQEISTVARSKTISEKEIQSLTDSFFISDFEALSGSESMQSSVVRLDLPEAYFQGTSAIRVKESDTTRDTDIVKDMPNMIIKSEQTYGTENVSAYLHKHTTSITVIKPTATEALSTVNIKYPLSDKIEESVTISGTDSIDSFVKSSYNSIEQADMTKSNLPDFSHVISKFSSESLQSLQTDELLIHSSAVYPSEDLEMKSESKIRPGITTETSKPSPDVIPSSAITTEIQLSSATDDMSKPSPDVIPSSAITTEIQLSSATDDISSFAFGSFGKNSQISSSSFVEETNILYASELSKVSAFTFESSYLQDETYSNTFASGPEVYQIHSPSMYLSQTSSEIVTNQETVPGHVAGRSADIYSVTEQSFSIKRDSLMTSFTDYMTVQSLSAQQSGIIEKVENTLSSLPSDSMLADPESTSMDISTPLSKQSQEATQLFEQTTHSIHTVSHHDTATSSREQISISELRLETMSPDISNIQLSIGSFQVIPDTQSLVSEQVEASYIGTYVDNSFIESSAHQISMPISEEAHSVDTKTQSPSISSQSVYSEIAIRPSKPETVVDTMSLASTSEKVYSSISEKSLDLTPTLPNNMLSAFSIQPSKPETASDSPPSEAPIQSTKLETDISAFFTLSFSVYKVVLSDLSSTKVSKHSARIPDTEKYATPGHEKSSDLIDMPLSLSATTTTGIFSTDQYLTVVSSTPYKIADDIQIRTPKEKTPMISEFAVNTLKLRDMEITTADAVSSYQYNLESSYDSDFPAMAIQATRTNTLLSKATTGDLSVREDSYQVSDVNASEILSLQPFHSSIDSYSSDVSVSYNVISRKTTHPSFVQEQTSAIFLDNIASDWDTITIPSKFFEQNMNSTLKKSQLISITSDFVVSGSNTISGLFYDNAITDSPYTETVNLIGTPLVSVATGGILETFDMRSDSQNYSITSDRNDTTLETSYLRTSSDMSFQAISFTPSTDFYASVQTVYGSIGGLDSRADLMTSEEDILDPNKTSLTPYKSLNISLISTDNIPSLLMSSHTNNLPTQSLAHSLSMTPPLTSLDKKELIQPQPSSMYLISNLNLKNISQRVDEIELMSKLVASSYADLHVSSLKDYTPFVVSHDSKRTQISDRSIDHISSLSSLKPIGDYSKSNLDINSISTITSSDSLYSNLQTSELSSKQSIDLNATKSIGEIQTTADASRILTSAVDSSFDTSQTQTFTTTAPYNTHISDKLSSMNLFQVEDSYTQSSLDEMLTNTVLRKIDTSFALTEPLQSEGFVLTATSVDELLTTSMLTKTDKSDALTSTKPLHTEGISVSPTTLDEILTNAVLDGINQLDTLTSRKLLQSEVIRVTSSKDTSSIPSTDGVVQISVEQLLFTDKSELMSRTVEPSSVLDLYSSSSPSGDYSTYLDEMTFSNILPVLGESKLNSPHTSSNFSTNLSNLTVLSSQLPTIVGLTSSNTTNVLQTSQSYSVKLFPMSSHVSLSISSAYSEFNLQPSKSYELHSSSDLGTLIESSFEQTYTHALGIFKSSLHSMINSVRLTGSLLPYDESRYVNISSTPVTKPSSQGFAFGESTQSSETYFHTSSYTNQTSTLLPYDIQTDIPYNQSSMEPYNYTQSNYGNQITVSSEVPLTTSPTNLSYETNTRFFSSHLVSSSLYTVEHTHMLDIQTPLLMQDISVSTTLESSVNVEIHKSPTSAHQSAHVELVSPVHTTGTAQVSDSYSGVYSSISSIVSFTPSAVSKQSIASSYERSTVEDSLLPIRHASVASENLATSIITDQTFSWQLDSTIQSTEHFRFQTKNPSTVHLFSDKSIVHQLAKSLSNSIGGSRIQASHTVFIPSVLVQNDQQSYSERESIFTRMTSGDSSFSGDLVLDLSETVMNGEKSGITLTPSDYEVYDSSSDSLVDVSTPVVTSNLFSSSTMVSFAPVFDSLNTLSRISATSSLPSLEIKTKSFHENATVHIKGITSMMLGPLNTVNSSAIQHSVDFAETTEYAHLESLTKMINTASQMLLSNTFENNPSVREFGATNTNSASFGMFLSSSENEMLVSNNVMSSMDSLTFTNTVSDVTGLSALLMTNLPTSTTFTTAIDSSPPAPFDTSQPVSSFQSTQTIITTPVSYVNTSSTLLNKNTITPLQSVGSPYTSLNVDTENITSTCLSCVTNLLVTSFSITTSLSVQKTSITNTSILDIYNTSSLPSDLSGIRSTTFNVQGLSSSVIDGSQAFPLDDTDFTYTNGFTSIGTSLDENTSISLHATDIPNALSFTRSPTTLNFASITTQGNGTINSSNTVNIINNHSLRISATTSVSLDNITDISTDLNWTSQAVSLNNLLSTPMPTTVFTAINSNIGSFALNPTSTLSTATIDINTADTSYSTNAFTALNSDSLNTMATDFPFKADIFNSTNTPSTLNSDSLNTMATGPPFIADIFNSTNTPSTLNSHSLNATETGHPFIADIYNSTTNTPSTLNSDSLNATAASPYFIADIFNSTTNTPLTLNSDSLNATAASPYFVADIFNSTNTPLTLNSDSLNATETGPPFVADIFNSTNTPSTLNSDSLNDTATGPPFVADVFNSTNTPSTLNSDSLKATSTGPSFVADIFNSTNTPSTLNSDSLNATETGPNFVADIFNSTNTPSTLNSDSLNDTATGPPFVADIFNSTNTPSTLNSDSLKATSTGPSFVADIFNSTNTPSTLNSDSLNATETGPNFVADIFNSTNTPSTLNSDSLNDTATGPPFVADIFNSTNTPLTLNSDSLNATATGPSFVADVFNSTNTPSTLNSDSIKATSTGPSFVADIFNSTNTPSTLNSDSLNDTATGPPFVADIFNSTNTPLTLNSDSLNATATGPSFVADIFNSTNTPSTLNSDSLNATSTGPPFVADIFNSTNTPSTLNSDSLNATATSPPFVADIFNSTTLNSDSLNTATTSAALTAAVFNSTESLTTQNRDPLNFTTSSPLTADVFNSIDSFTTLNRDPLNFTTSSPLMAYTSTSLNSELLYTTTSSPLTAYTSTSLNSELLYTTTSTTFTPDMSYPTNFSTSLNTNAWSVPLNDTTNSTNIESISGNISITSNNTSQSSLSDFMSTVSIVPVASSTALTSTLLNNTREFTSLAYSYFSSTPRFAIMSSSPSLIIFSSTENDISTPSLLTIDPSSTLTRNPPIKTNIPTSHISHTSSSRTIPSLSHTISSSSSTLSPLLITSSLEPVFDITPSIPAFKTEEVDPFAALFGGVGSSSGELFPDWVMSMIGTSGIHPVSSSVHPFRN